MSACGAAEDLTTNRKPGLSPTVGKKPEVADANEALRQDVQEKSAQELDGSQCHDAVLPPCA